MKQFDTLYNPYHSQRNPVVAKKGMVATSQPLAAQAGLTIMQNGGNAIDAAIATAAALTVVEPTTNGIGGDAFALVWVKDTLYGLNGSGKSPESISIDKVRAAGYDEIPKYGFTPVTVPGQPGAWAELSRRFGKLPFKDLMQPAIQYAEEGYPLSPVLAKLWDRAAVRFKEAFEGDEFDHWFETFTPNGRAPRVGEIWKSQDMADTLRELAETGCESFYTGNIARKIDDFSRAYDGYITKEDLAAYKPEWVDPISVNYRGYDVWEIPPNTQGIIALSALNILKNMDIEDKESADTYHKQIEAMKMAFADGEKYIADQAYMKDVTAEDMLDEAYAKELLKLITDQAGLPEAGEPKASGTVYLSTADEEGNMVSFIQSNYMGFGSGLVVPGTGIGLQNRGCDFNLDLESPNALGPGKRSYHTIIPGFITKGKEALGPFGVMGGFMQPQGHVQVAMNTIDFDLNPQTALDAPRWQWVKDKTVWVERNFPHQIAEDLIKRGHNIEMKLDSGAFGRGQIIWRDPETGILYGGTENRADGHIAAY